MKLSLQQKHAKTVFVRQVHCWTRTLCSTFIFFLFFACTHRPPQSFVEQFVLPRDREQWAQEYGVQLAAQHGAYLQQVREEIRLQSHNLRMFHARPDHAREEDPFGLGDLSNLDAMSKLVTLVLTAVRHSRRMSSLHGEVGHPISLVVTD